MAIIFFISSFDNSLILFLKLLFIVIFGFLGNSGFMSMPTISLLSLK